MTFPKSVFTGTPLSIDHLDLLHWRLLWIYDAPLDSDAGQRPYCDYPTAAWLVRSGTVELEFNRGKKESYGPGQWIFPRQAEGLQSFRGDMRILSVRFHAEWPNGAPLFDRSRTLRIPADSEPALRLEETATRLCRFLEKHLPAQVLQRRLTSMTIEQYLEIQPLFFAWLRGYSLAMLANGCEPVTFSITHRAAQLALSHLLSCQLNRPLQMPELADRTGISLSQLNKIFVKEMGMTPNAFWTQHRLKAARAELANSSESIKSIALNLGFSTPEAFTRWFRACSGHSPRAYRKAALHAN